MATSGSHGGEFKPAGPTHDFGYEPDQFAVKTILVVPVAVIISGVLAYVVTSVLFANIFNPSDPKLGLPAKSEAAAQAEGAPLNDRLARTSSTDPKAENKQPRLEGLIRQKSTKPDAKSPYTVTGGMTTMQPTKEGNSPQYVPERLRADNVTALTTPGVDPETGFHRIPVDQAIQMMLAGNMFPSEAKTGLDIEPAWNRPKESNGGHGRVPTASNPAPSAKAKGSDDKKEPEKKGNGKDPAK